MISSGEEPVFNFSSICSKRVLIDFDFSWLLCCCGRLDSDCCSLFVYLLPLDFDFAFGFDFDFFGFIEGSKY